MSDPIIAEAADGSQHEFPAETNPAIVDRVMKQYAMQGKIRARMTLQGGALRNFAAGSIEGVTGGLAALSDPGAGDELGALGISPHVPMGTPAQGQHALNLGLGAVDLNPETVPNDSPIARRAGGLSMAALAPGGIMARAARVALPTAGGTIGNELGGPGGEVLGTLAGGGVQAAGEGAFNAGRAFVSAQTSARAAPQDYAKALILKAMQADKVDPRNAAQLLERYPEKPLNIMDIGGSNTARLGRTINTLGGDSGEQMARVLSERQADQNGRVLQDISSSLANGSDVHAIGQKLIEQQKTAAQPLYEAAYKANQNIASPEIDKILETPAGKQALSDARTMMQNDMRLMGVPDAELREQAKESGQALPKGGAASGLKLETLDYVKKALDDQIGGALKANEGRRASVLIGLKNKLLDAADAADSTLSTGPNSENPKGGLYKQARAAFAGPAQSMDSIESGKNFLDLSPDELKDAMGKLPESNQQLFKVGAGRALQDRINSVADNRDAVARVFGNVTIRNQIDAVFGNGASTKFAESMTPENMMTGTNRLVTGGSNTMNKAADISGLGGSVGEDVAMGALHGGVRGAITRPLLNVGGAKIKAFFNAMTPEVRQAMSELLTRTGSDASSAANNLPVGNLPPLTVNNRPVSGIPALSTGALARLLQSAPNNTQ